MYIYVAIIECTGPVRVWLLWSKHRLDCCNPTSPSSCTFSTLPRLCIRSLHPVPNKFRKLIHWNPASPKKSSSSAALPPWRSLQCHWRQSGSGCKWGGGKLQLGQGRRGNSGKCLRSGSLEASVDLHKLLHANSVPCYCVFPPLSSQSLSKCSVTWGEAIGDSLWYCPAEGFKTILKSTVEYPRSQRPPPWLCLPGLCHHLQKARTTFLPLSLCMSDLSGSSRKCFYQDNSGTFLHWYTHWRLNCHH